MSTPCTSPLSWETLVDYWAADLGSDDEARVEEHLFSCASCTAQAERSAVIIEGVRRRLPPLLSLELLARLRAQGARIRENPIAPGEVSRAHVGFDVDVFLHVLHGLDLSTADRVAFELRVENTGQIMFAVDNAPFDRAGSRVLVACSIHYRGLPPNLVAEVRAIGKDGGESRAQYTIHHTFDSGDPGNG